MSKVLLYMLHVAQDQDTAFALGRLSASTAATGCALSLEQFGQLVPAQKLLVQTIKDHNVTTQEESSSSSSSSAEVEVNTIELDVWEQRWVHIAKELSQWPVLSDYASNLQLTDLGAEVAAVRCDWDALRRLRTSPSVVAQLVGENAIIHNLSRNRKNM